MNCRKVQSIIITDYLDAELDEKSRATIEQHLAGCPACRSYKQRLLTRVAEPLRQAARMEPPAELWLQIRNDLDRVTADNEEIDIRDSLIVFRPQWMNAALVIIMLLCTMLAGNYCVASILGSMSQHSSQATEEFANNLELGEFNDIPHQQAETVYTNMIGG
jgi:predicted anti-sigma-YlaC factor YlaD